MTILILGILCGVACFAFCVVAFIACKTNQEDPDNEEYP